MTRSRRGNLRREGQRIYDIHLLVANIWVSTTLEKSLNRSLASEVNGVVEQVPFHYVDSIDVSTTVCQTWTVQACGSDKMEHDSPVIKVWANAFAPPSGGM